MREKCGLSLILSLQERPTEINEVNPDRVDNYLVQENWAKLNEVYQKVDDIDLYVGGLSETPVGGIKGKVVKKGPFSSYLLLSDKTFNSDKGHEVMI